MVLVVVHFPRIQKGELAAALVGRIKLVNGCLDIRGWRDVVLMANGIYRPVSLVEDVAKLIGVERIDLLSNHTLLPFGGFLDLPTKANSKAWSPTIAFRHFLSTGRTSAYLCSECVAQDLANGYSYWRVEHQLDGQYVCRQHACVLSRVEDRTAFLGLPQCAAHAAHATPRSIAHAKEPLIAIFGDFVRALQQLSGPIARQDYRCVLWERATTMGYRSNAQKAWLSDAVAKAYPREWLQDVFPDIESKSMGVFFQPIDDCLLKECRAPALAHCLALALMFNDPSELFSLLADEA